MTEELEREVDKILENYPGTVSKSVERRIRAQKGLPAEKQERHHCEREPQSMNDHAWAWGPAFYKCFEIKDGTFRVEGREYGNQVNFCPFCGAEAPVPLAPDRGVDGY